MARIRNSLRRSAQGGRSEITPFLVRAWEEGWRPDLQKTGAPPTTLFDLVNIIWNPDYTISKRHGFTNIIETQPTGLGPPDHLLAPRVFTATGGVFPNYTQQVLYFEKTTGELWYNSLGNLWENFSGVGTEALTYSTESIGPASDSAINRFRVWPITAVTFADKIYMTTLRFGGYDSTTNQGDETAAGLWQTQSGAKNSPSRPIVFDVLNSTFARPQLHDLNDADTTGFPSCRTIITKYGRLFAANLHKEGVYRYPSRVYWAGTDDAELGVDPHVWMTDNWISCGADDGQEVVRLLSFGDQILILKNQSVWTLVGTDETTFALYQLDDKIGCEGTYACTSTAGAAYFFDTKTGVWSFDGSQFVNISLPIKEKLLAEVNLDAAYKIVCEIVGKYLYVSIPVTVASLSADVNTITYVYDLDLGVWSRWDYGIIPTPFPMYSDFNVVDTNIGTVRNAFSGRAVNGVFMLNDELNDDGVAIRSHITTPWMNPGDLMDEHRLRRLELLADEADATIVIDAFTNLEFDVAKGQFTWNPGPGTENAAQAEQGFDKWLWSWLSLRFTQNGLNEDMNLFGLGMSVSSRSRPRGVTTKTGYQHS